MMFPSDKEKAKARRRFGVALAASIAAHALLAMLITVAHGEKPPPRKKPPKIMDVVLLDSEYQRQLKPPKEAEAISNRNAVGGSADARDKLTRSARAPIIGERKPQRPTPPARPKTPKPEITPQRQPRMLAKRGPTPSGKQPAKPPTKPHPEPKPAPPSIPLSNLMPSSMALAELSRDFEREKRLKQMLSREMDIPINTREAKYAPYAQALVRILEEQWRPGQANYDRFPEEARRALIKLTIEHDGSLGGIEILRPSPIAQINETAIQAIHAAAPFRPLPSSWGLDRVSFYLTFEVIEERFVFRAM